MVPRCALIKTLVETMVLLEGSLLVGATVRWVLVTPMWVVLLFVVMFSVQSAAGEKGLLETMPVRVKSFLKGRSVLFRCTTVLRDSDSCKTSLLPRNIRPLPVTTFAEMYSRLLQKVGRSVVWLSLSVGLKRTFVRRVVRMVLRACRSMAMVLKGSSALLTLESTSPTMGGACPRRGRPGPQHDAVISLWG